MSKKPKIDNEINLTLPSKNVKVSVFENNDEKIPYGLSINIADVFILKFAKVVNSKNGMFISYPSYEIKNGRRLGEYNSFYYIMDNSFKEELIEKVKKQNEEIEEK